MTEQEYDIYLEGYIAGLCAFAWWKDGVQYVGTTGKTLNEAITLARAGKLWNQRIALKDAPQFMP